MQNETFKYLSKTTADALALAAQLLAEDILKAIAGNADQEQRISISREKEAASQQASWGIDEVAAFCGVKPRTVRAWVADVKRSGIPFSRPKGTRRLRFDATAVRAWAKDSGLSTRTV